jgi:MFS transporter, PPP family, 3-phenylpropionic acid transporter
MPDLQGLGSVAAAIAGWLHNRVGSWLVPWLLTAGYGAAVLFTPFLPEAAPPPPGFAGPRLFRNKPFRLAVASTALIQGAHAAYYGLAALFWRSQGLRSREPHR